MPVEHTHPFIAARDFAREALLEVAHAADRYLADDCNECRDALHTALVTWREANATFRRMVAKSPKSAALELA